MPSLQWFTELTQRERRTLYAGFGGYAVDDEENSLGARCLGAPIPDTAGNVTAALGVSGTLTQVDEENLPKIVEALKETARRISRELMMSGVAGPV